MTTRRLTAPARSGASLTKTALAAVAAGAAVWMSSPTPVRAQAKDYRQIQTPPLHAFTIPQPQRTVLDNGMVVMLIENHELPLVELTARIRTGSRLDPAEKAGLAGLVGRTMRSGGTARMSGDQIDDYLEARAATIETNIGIDSGSASLSCLKQDFDDTLKVFADILRAPAFADDKLKIAKNQALSAITRRNDNPQGIMNREFAKLIYGQASPYARVSELATVEPITRDDLAAFHKAYFSPNRIIVGATGDFDAKEMLAKLRTAFGDWPKGPARKDPESTWQKASKPGVYYVEKEDMTQSNIILGHMGIRKDDPDFYAIEVMNEVLGGGFQARMFSNVRSKKGLAYSVRGGVESNFDYPGTFNTWMTTKTETTAAGIDALMAEIHDIVARPATDEEVKRAKESILSSFVFNFDSTAKILRQQMTYEYFGYPADYLTRYRQNIEKVTTADVARVAAKTVHKDQLAMLVVGPSKGQDRPLDTFGPVTKLDITIPGAVARRPGGEGSGEGKPARGPRPAPEGSSKGDQSSVRP